MSIRTTNEAVPAQLSSIWGPAGRDLCLLGVITHPDGFSKIGPGLAGMHRTFSCPGNALFKETVSINKPRIVNHVWYPAVQQTTLFKESLPLKLVQSWAGMYGTFLCEANVPVKRQSLKNRSSVCGLACHLKRQPLNRGRSVWSFQEK